MAHSQTNLEYPFDASEILRKKKGIKRELLARNDFIDKRIAILGGSTTAEIKNILEIFLLNAGIRPEFYESAFGKYYEDVLFENETLKQFKPDIVYVHTTAVNITAYPKGPDTAEEIEDRLKSEFSRFETLWEKIRSLFNCEIIQNNFELPFYRTLGNLDFSDLHGKTNFIHRLNAEFAAYCRSHPEFHINDINYLSSWFGLGRWLDPVMWHSYKYALSYDAIPLLAHNVAKIIRAIYGKSKKCLVVDLDNTLWGGIVGDDGVNNLQIGRDTPIGEAYTSFQEYLKELKNRGILLSISSKNNPAAAGEALAHPENVLKESDFSAKRVNWDPKPQNIASIAKELNLGIDGLVFVDDNPAEREIVRSQLPGIGVPEAGSDVTGFITCLDKEGYFEPASLSADDLNRSEYYDRNRRRDEYQVQFANHDEFLKSLEMKAEIDEFRPIYLDRIVQLVNKTNQFNLTTRRYTHAEIQACCGNRNCITLAGRLTDKFGDNGIVSIILGRREETQVHIDLWLMSCRVFSRGMEWAMFDALVEKCREQGIQQLVGYYSRTAKNELVSSLYTQLGFTEISQNEKGDRVWKWTIPVPYTPKNSVITRSCNGSHE